MMTSLLLIDVQGFEALAKGQANAAALRDELTHTMHGMNRQLAVMRAYCSSRVSSYRKTAYREAGFEIVETTGPEDTLIRMSLDFAELAQSDVTYQEAILMAGTTDLTSLARFAREHLMMVSVMDHASVPASLEALADGLLDIEDFEIDRMAGPPPAPTFKTRDRAPIEPLIPRNRNKDADEETKPSEAIKAESADDEPAKDEADEAKSPDKDGKTETSAKNRFASTGSSLASKSTSSADASDSKAEPKETERKRFSDVSKDAKSEDDSKSDTQSKSAAKEPQSTKPTSSISKPEPDTKSDENELAGNLEEALAASISDDLAGALDTAVEESPAIVLPAPDTGSDLEADLAADIAAELDVDVPAETPKPTDEAGANSDLDALFADLANGDGAESTPSETAVAAAVDAAIQEEPLDLAKAADEQADAEVDQLLSRLMSDDIASDADAPKKAALDVVPER